MERAFEVNKIFSESCKRMRLRTSLRMPPSSLAQSDSDKPSAGVIDDESDPSRKTGTIRQFGETKRRSVDRGGRNVSAKTLPCIPLTGKQHDTLGEAAIIRRLVRRQNFEFAAQVCNFLAWSKESVLLHWSRAKIHSLPPPPDR